jgi:hypothetical protein
MKPVFLNRPYREWQREQRRMKLWREFVWLAMGLALIALGMGLGCIICKY